jgi:ribosomal protein S10
VQQRPVAAPSGTLDVRRTLQHCEGTVLALVVYHRTRKRRVPVFVDRVHERSGSRIRKQRVQCAVLRNMQHGGPATVNRGIIPDTITRKQRRKNLHVAGPTHKPQRRRPVVGARGVHVDARIRDQYRRLAGLSCVQSRHQRRVAVLVDAVDVNVSTS